jgi:hypothetical protein
MPSTKMAKRKRNSKPNVPSDKIRKLEDTVPISSTVTGPKLLSIISDEEMEITVDTLATLATFPSVIKSKSCKDLRVAVYNFGQACTTGMNAASKSSRQHVFPGRCWLIRKNSRYKSHCSNFRCYNG